MTELTDRAVEPASLDLDPDDFSTNPSGTASFADVVQSRISRRSVLRGGMLAAAGFMTSSLVADTSVAHAASRPAGAPRGGLLGFSPIPLSTADEVVVPAGYRATPFIPWGTPLTPSGPRFVPGSPDVIGTGNSAAEQEQQVGMHHDGMHFFPLGENEQASRHGLLVVNHEYTDENYLHTGTSSRPAREQYTTDMVRKSQAAHGVSVVEVREDTAGSWKVMPSRRNRRITANTPMTFSGPAAGSALLDTGRAADGTNPVGTVNNCSHGDTPWNTYLTCEENFNGYFRVEADDGADTAALQRRYGIGGDRYNWSARDARFLVTAQRPNEPNRFGWVVEIDPFASTSTPVKRTALGRMKHEGAFVQVADDGRVVVYMGDDQVNEYAYKYVSARPWRETVSRGRSPLDDGTLYAAKFNDDGTGEWLALVHGSGPLLPANGFADQGEVLVRTRSAADAVGATRMDRPEWTTVDPSTGMVYLTLTNNTSGAKQPNAANPRTPNPWGHIIRWAEQGGDHTAIRFTWDLFLLAGQGRESGDGSTIDAEDGFGSPDGLWADPTGRIWIQTDGRQPGAANNQMLVADPTTVDRRGHPDVRRFLTGVVGCEVTGVVTTPDQRTMFVNLQHPSGASTWPHQDGLSTPRSATVVIVKDDGGVIGT